MKYKNNLFNMNKESEMDLFDPFPLRNQGHHQGLPLWLSWWRSGMCLWQVGIKETKSNLLFLKAL